MESLISMTNRRSNTSKCFKKWGCCTSILPKTLAHYKNFKKKSKIQKQKFKKKIQKKGTEPDWSCVDPRPKGDRCAIFLNFFFLLSSIFWACGQILLVGSSTCPPYPDFSSKLQTSIRFDP
jgi:hypothetical protein